jgi:REP element-mobilizing transposase RayT
VGSGFSRTYHGASIARPLDMSPRHPEHLSDFDYQGLYRYSLRFCTIGRQEISIAQSVVDLVYEQFLRAAREASFALITYCLMPDHVHLLVAGTSEDADCKEFIARAKQYSGFYYKKLQRRRLWQRYGFERVLRDDEATLVVARYILENPVRAGLVTDPRHYPFLGSAVYSLEEILCAVQDDVVPDFDLTKL